jgi:Domain of unknown function (DUF4123)
MEVIEDASVDLMKAYILVDPCNYGEFDPEGMELVPCIPAHMANGQDLMPRLINGRNLSSLNHARLIETTRQQIEEQHPFAICAILNSEVDIDELAEHIAQFITGPGPDGKGLLWRYFDPRVFSTTVSSCSEIQRKALLGPIEKWQFTWFQKWWSVSGGREKVDALEIFDRAWPSPKQGLSISQSRMLNRVLNKLYSEEKMEIERLLAYQKTASEYLIEGLSFLHLNDEEDRVEFAYLCTKYGMTYRQHPRLRMAWLALQNGEISWTEVRLQLDIAEKGKL